MVNSPSVPSFPTDFYHYNDCECVPVSGAAWGLMAARLPEQIGRSKYM